MRASLPYISLNDLLAMFTVSTPVSIIDTENDVLVAELEGVNEADDFPHFAVTGIRLAGERINVFVKPC